MKTDAVFTSNAQSRTVQDRSRHPERPAAIIGPMRAREPLGAVHHGGALELSATGSRGSRGLSSPAGWIGLAGLLIAALLISLSAAHTEVLLPASLRQSLGGLAGAFGHVGLDIGLPGLIAAMVLMFVSYAVALRAAKHLSRRAVLVEHRGAQRARAGRAAAAVDGPVQLHRLRPAGRHLRRQPVPVRAERHLLRPPLSPGRRPVDPHAHRLRAAVHRAQLSAGRAEHRHQRLRLQGDRRAVVPRESWCSCGTPPSCAAWTPSRRSRSSGSTR